MASIDSRLGDDCVQPAGTPQMPKDYCPFCPSFGNVPDYEVLEYDNDFPALSQNPPKPDEGIANDFFKVKPSYGKCEVILYSPGHNGDHARSCPTTT